MTFKLKYLLPTLIMVSLPTFGQKRPFVHEFGVYLGPSVFISEYGERSISSQIQNLSVDMGLVFYLNFKKERDPPNKSGINFSKNDTLTFVKSGYFGDHFKLKSGLNFISWGSLRNHGKLVNSEKTSFIAEQFRKLRGEVIIFTLDSQIEWSPFSLSNFDLNYKKFPLRPYVSFGFGYSFFNRRVHSSLGPIDKPFSTPEVFLGGIHNGRGTSWSIVSTLGFKYRLNKSSMLILEGRYQAFFEDSVDGLTSDIPNSAGHTEFLFSSNIGYVRNFNF